MSLVDENIKIMVQKPSGEVYEMTGIVNEMLISCMGYQTVVMDLSIVGTELLTWYGNEYTEHIKDARKAPEWKCDFCGRPNKRKRETCKSCGAVRPFIYD